MQARQVLCNLNFPPVQRKEHLDFLISLPTCGQKRKGEQWDLKAVSRQASKIESDSLLQLSYAVVITPKI